MTPAEARDLILRAVTEIAPEADTATVAEDEPLQEQLDLDSMDFLSILGAIADEAGIEIPERDYPQLATLGSGVAYLVEHGS